MNDQTGPIPTEPSITAEPTSADPLTPAGPAGHPAHVRPGAPFSGRTPPKLAAVRAGMIIGTGLVIVIGAAVAMGASPAPAPSGPATRPAVPGQGGPRVGGPGGFPGFGPFGPGGGLGRGGGFGLGPGGPSTLPAFGPGGIPGRRFGQVTVTAVSGSSVSLATDDGWTRTITVTDATKITKGGVAATLADLAVGDVVRLAQTRNADGSYTITAIGTVLPQVAGTVKAIDASTITITLRDGTSATIRTTGSTAYHIDQADGKRSDVTVGATILATGDKGADSSLTASSVWVRLPRVVGMVTAVTGDTVTLSRRDGTVVTVHVGAGTTIRVAGTDSAKLSDVKPGMGVVVEGTQRADGSLDARAIGAGLPGKGFERGTRPGPAPHASPAPSASSGTVG